MTKRFEEFAEMKAQDLETWAKTHEPKGEYVVLIDECEKKKSNDDTVDEETLRWARLIAAELPASRAAAIAAKASGAKREAIYKALMQEGK